MYPKIIDIMKNDNSIYYTNVFRVIRLKKK